MSKEVRYGPQDGQFMALETFVDNCVPAYRPDATAGDRQIVDIEWSVARRELLAPIFNGQSRATESSGSDNEYLTYQVDTLMGVAEVGVRRKEPSGDDENRIILVIKCISNGELYFLNFMRGFDGKSKVIHFIGPESESDFVQK